MRIIRRLAFGLAVCAVVSSTAWAQSAAPDTRPASSTVFGDTGLWFVPIAETLPKGEWAGGAQRVALNRSEGFANIADIGGMGTQLMLQPP